MEARIASSRLASSLSCKTPTASRFALAPAPTRCCIALDRGCRRLSTSARQSPTSSTPLPALRARPRQPPTSPLSDAKQVGRSLATAASSPPAKMYTASFAFFEALWELGVTHCFVNLGSDHPSIIEAMVKGQRARSGSFSRIITCPNEMVAMSMADGYARLSGEPQAVLVHVDVGTQGLGAAVHNAAAGRAPVLIFAGLSPFTQDGELCGSRTEYIHWVQDMHDQRAIVAQYCRYTAELKTGRNVKQMVARALQFATSDPKGPVYLCGAREVLEAEMEPYTLKQGVWGPVKLAGLPEDAADRIGQALLSAKKPVVLTGYAGRNHAFAPALADLATRVPALRVLDTGGSDMSFPADHPAWRGLRYGSDASIREADVVLIVDNDVPWVPTQCVPPQDARIFHIDVDPLKEKMPVFWMDVAERFRADAETAMRQIASRVGGKAESAQSSAAAARERENEHAALVASIAERARPQDDGAFGSTHLSSVLRKLCPDDTVFAVEAVTNSTFVSDGLQARMPGTWINCGGGGLGWSGGAALGIKLAVDAESRRGSEKKRMVVQIIGDGSFLFSVPGSVYWIAKRYDIPVLTVVLNNKGWNAPRRSLLLVHPNGLAASASNDELNISIDNPMPDYPGIAKAAAGGDLFTARVGKAGELEKVLGEAIAEVQGGRTAVVDCTVLGGC